MAKIILQGFIEVSDEDMDAVLEELPNHIDLTRQEPGCIVFKVERDSGNRSRFEVYEEFENQEAFNQHQARVKASRWGKVTVNARRNYTVTNATSE